MPARLSMKERVEQAVRKVRDRCAGTPAVGLVLGSGWGLVAERSRTATIIPYAEIPGFPGVPWKGMRAIWSLTQVGGR